MEVEYYPPYPFLYQVSRHCPEAVSLYLELWQKKDVHNQIYVKFHEIAEFFCVSRTRFHNLLLRLAREGVSGVRKTSDGFCVNLTEWFDYEGVAHD